MELNECFGMESGPVFCLQVCGWVPAGVKDDDTVCTSNVQTHSSTSAQKRKTESSVCVGGGRGGARGDEWVVCELESKGCGMDASSILLIELFTHPFTFDFSEKAKMMEALNFVEELEEEITSPV